MGVCAICTTWRRRKCGCLIQGSRSFLLRRKGTYYIQTWHGTPLKKLALDMEDVFMVGESDIDSYKEHFYEKRSYMDFF